GWNYIDPQTSRPARTRLAGNFLHDDLNRAVSRLAQGRGIDLPEFRRSDRVVCFLRFDRKLHHAGHASDRHAANCPPVRTAHRSFDWIARCIDWIAVSRSAAVIPPARGSPGASPHERLLADPARPRDDLYDCRSRKPLQGEEFYRYHGLS